MSDEMSDRESAYVFAEFAYPSPENDPLSDELQAAFVSGWAHRMRRDAEYGLADRIEHVFSEEWLRGRVLPCMVGAEDQARLKEIRRILDEYITRT